MRMIMTNNEVIKLISNFEEHGDIVILKYIINPTQIKAHLLKNMAKKKLTQ